MRFRCGGHLIWICDYSELRKQRGTWQRRKQLDRLQAKVHSKYGGECGPMCCPPTVTQRTIFSASATEIQWCNPCENLVNFSIIILIFKKRCERWWCMVQKSKDHACVCTFLFFSYMMPKKQILSLQLPNNFSLFLCFWQSHTSVYISGSCIP